jgi:UDP-N-acetylmuramate--alanine ligase
MPNPLRSVHLVGVCGSGMYPLAQALLAEGVKVSGSDLDAEKGEKLACLGARICTGHAAENVQSPDAIVISTAIPADNPEVVAARAKGIPVFHRSQMLGWFLARCQSILIAGTHGKTTTTALAGLLMEKAGLDPWCFVGGRVSEFGGGNFRVGRSRIAVAEADESDGSFLNLPRHHLIITNIEAEHLNYWGSYEALEQGFLDLIAGMPEDGELVVCVDDPGIRALLPRVSRRYSSYSLGGHEADYSARNLLLSGEGCFFEVHEGRELLCGVTIGIPGRHNASNTLAVFALLRRMGVDVRPLATALTHFRGVDRRFTRREAPHGFLVIDDYAHHPTEIAATVSAARQLANERGGRLLGVFQPHRYTRIGALFNDFGSCFRELDELVVLDIYAGGETPISGVSGGNFHQKLCSQYQIPVHFMPSIDDVKKNAPDMLKNTDIVLLLGAGSVTKLATLLTNHADARCR